MTESKTFKIMECFEPEKNNPYPLCEGKGWSDCLTCSLYKNYDILNCNEDEDID